MKSKKSTYVLLGVVALVWGLIGYRVWGAVSNDETISLHTVHQKEALFNKMNHQHDTVQIVVDYPDPFDHALVIVEKPVSAMKGHVASSASMTPQPPKLKVDWSVIRYIGYIKGTGKKHLALLSVRDLEFSLTEGQTAHEINLKRLTPDSVWLGYKGEKKYVKIN